MKLSVKRLLAVALALVLCLSLLPGIAMAAEAYTKVTSVAEITAGGQFVLVADGYAMTTAITGNKKFAGVAVNAGGSSMTGTDVPVWTIEAVSGGIALSTGGQYLGYETSTNFIMQDTAYTWTVTAGDNGGFIIKSADSPKRGIFLQTSASRFGAYSTTNTSGYVFELLLYKPASDVPVCDHNYTSEVTTYATCTENGVETFTCTKCSDSYTKAIEAYGHTYVVRECLYCDAVIINDPAKIVPEAYALADGESLSYESILTGKIISVDEEYSDSFKNITVTIAVEGYEDQPIQCYRLKGTGAEALTVGDVISVYGTIKNYKSTIEFTTGCTLITLAPENPEQIVKDAYALAEGEALTYEAVLTGEITSVDEAYSDAYKNITVTIAVEGCEDKPIVCFRMKGEGVDALQVGDVITVAGTIKNYYGKVEFEKPYMLEKAVEGGCTVNGAVATGADGDTTIELIADGKTVASTTASGKDSTYIIENVAAGTYTLKVSKLNHVTREYTVTVDADLTQDVKIHMVGDVDGNGKINVGDVSKINSHIKSGSLTDEYMILCANVNGGKLNMGDVSTLYAHIKGTKKLY